MHPSVAWMSGAKRRGRKSGGGFPEHLNKIAHTRTYQPTKPVSLPLLHHRLFKLQALHKFTPSVDLLEKNRRGFATGASVTAALAPSLTHYLFNKGGICFDEAAELLQQRRIEVDGTVVESQRQMESQEFWYTVAERDIRIRPAEGGGGPAVPVAHRALHRKYFITYVNPVRQNITTEVADPKSLLHRLATVVGPTDRLGMNIVRPIGYITGMGGLAIVTNDVLTLRHWNNEHVGNYGVYSVRLHRGAPQEELAAVEAMAAKALAPVLAQQHRDVCGDYGCRLVDAASPLDEAGGASYDEVLAPHVPESVMQTLHGTSLIIQTPLFPYRLFKALRSRTRMCTLVQMGPFVLPRTLQRGECRPLDIDELTTFFAFERRLKTNRLVFTLREFDEPDADIPEGTP
jgi:hypothetical protein